MADLAQLRTELGILKEKQAEADYDRAERERAAKRRAAGATKAKATAIPPDEMPYAPILRPSELDQRPNLVHTVDPVLSERLQLERKTKELQATVTIIIDTLGKPRNIKVINTSSPEFSQRVVEAVANWLFTPGIADGKPVSTRMTIPIKLSDEKPPQDPSASASAPH